MDPLHIEHSPVKNSSFDRAIDYGVAAALAALLLFMPLAFSLLHRNPKKRTSFTPARSPAE